MPVSYKFKAQLEIIGINPYVSVPHGILMEIFKQSGKEKGHIPIEGFVNGKPYKQTLVKYNGAWRLYVNTSMLAKSPKRIGETIEITIAFDPSDRTIKPSQELVNALNENADAKKAFERLSPSRQNEIIRYISFLKTEESIEKNVKRVINFLNGNVGFVGREKP